MNLSVVGRIVDDLSPNIFVHQLTWNGMRIGSGLCDQQVVANIVCTIATMVDEAMDGTVNLDFNLSLIICSPMRGRLDTCQLQELSWLLWF